MTLWRKEMRKELTPDLRGGWKYRKTSWGKASCYFHFYFCLKCIPGSSFPAYCSVKADMVYNVLQFATIQTSLYFLAPVSLAHLLSQACNFPFWEFFHAALRLEFWSFFHLHQTDSLAKYQLSLLYSLKCFLYTSNDFQHYTFTVFVYMAFFIWS